MSKPILLIYLALIFGLSSTGCSIQYADPYYGYLDEEKNFKNQGFIATMNQGGPFVRHPKKPERWKDLPAYTSKTCDQNTEHSPRQLKKFADQINKKIPGFTTHWQESQTQLRLEIPQNGIFYIDAAHLHPQAYPKLASLAQLMNKHQFKVHFIGHTDASGPKEYNMTLAGQRALHLQRYFVLKGLPQYLSSNASAGESAPIANNTTKDGRQKNRRVSMIFCIIAPKS